jgi:hypothetical protein
MSVIEFAPKGHFSIRQFSLVENGVPIGEIDCGGMREQATIAIGGASFIAAREGILTGKLYLEADGARLASAERLSAWRGGFTVRAGAATYALKSASWLGRAFVLTENDATIGSIARQGFFSRKSKADLPDKLAPGLKAFLIWLVISVWQRQATIAATTAAKTSVR